MKPHVVAARLDSEGDVLLAGPAVRAVAAGARRVTLLCGPRGRAAAELLPGVDEVLEFTAPWIDPQPPPVRRDAVDALVADIVARDVDSAVVLTSFHQSPLPTALVLRLAGVRRIAAISPDYPGSLLDVRHLVDDDRHEVERGVSLAEAAGFPLPEGDDMRLAIAHEPRPFSSDAYVVVHPGASVPARRWAPERTRDLVAELGLRGHRVYVTGGGRERKLTSFVAGGFPDAVDLGGRTTFAGLADVLAGAAAVVVGNTGPAHLAAAVGTPVVSIFAPTVPASRWHPWGVPYALLGEQAIECAGCRSKSCPFPGHPCISGVAVEDVADAVEDLAFRQTPMFAEAANEPTTVAMRRGAGLP